MKRLLPALLILGAALAPLPASAQDQPVLPVRFELLEQSPWNGPQSGGRTLRARLRIENTTDEPLEELTLGIGVYAAPRGRLEYEASLTSDATALLFAPDPRPVEPALAPGDSRDVPLTLNLDYLVDRAESGVFPMRLELRSDDVPVATIRSPIVFVVPEEEVRPLAVSTTLVLAETLHQDPSGSFLDRDLETIVGEVGWLGDLAAELARSPGSDYTLALSPVLLRQLAAMRGGYRVTGDDPGAVPDSDERARAAGTVLERLADVLREDGPELAGYPFAAPSLPALALGGLDRDIANQLGRGADVTERLLGRRPDPGLVRPPFGLVDAGALTELAALGDPAGPALLLDAETATPPEEEQGFNPASTGRIAARGAPDLEAVLPSASLASILEAIPEDPVLRAQAALGELAVIHGEEPGVGARGVALLLGDHRPIDPAFVRTFFAGVRAIPILRPFGTRAFLDELNSRAPLALEANRTFRTFSSEYEQAIRTARADIARFRATFPEAGERADELGELVLLAEGNQFIRNEAGGSRFLRHVTRAKTDRASRIVLPQRGQVFTLASRSLDLPIRIRNLTGGPVRVTIALISPGLRIGEGGVKTFEFDGEFATESFDIQATRGGRFPVAVVMCAPVPGSRCDADSPNLLGGSQIVIRSTVYNRVALLLTIGAALFLLIGYVRRIVRRRSAA